MAYNDNYDFIYPEGEDFYNVEDFNENFSKTADELDNKIDKTTVDDCVILASGTDNVLKEVRPNTIWDYLGTKKSDFTPEFITPDTAPTADSTSLVTSGGVYTALASKADSSHKHSASDITSGTLSVARGGTGNSSVDTTPTSGSTKMVTSDGVYTALSGYLPLTGGTLTGDLTLRGGTLQAYNTVYANALEVWSSSDTSENGGYLDFHYNQTIDTGQTVETLSDYTTRIIENAQGQLNIQAQGGSATLKVNGNEVLDVSTGVQVSDMVGDEDYVLTGTGSSFEWRAPIIKSLTGETVSTDSSTTKTAGTNATIVNDLRERTYSSTTASQGNVASGNYSFAEGTRTTASGGSSHSEGQLTTSSGDNSHAEGYNTTASNNASHAEGYGATASGGYSHAEGYNTTAGNQASHAEGYQTTASGSYSHAGGYYTTANAFQHVAGKYNVSSSGPTSVSSTSGDIFIIGNGTGSSATSNAFRISAAGVCYAGSSVEASGADFAEYFEWSDGNSESADRRGLFVTLEGEKIRIAKADDEYILGVVSAVPTVTGDSQSEVWKDMYLKDVFGEPVTETVTVEEYTDEETGEVIPEHEETRYVLNPEYDSEQTYISRDKRPEWAAVGLVGKLAVVDDGSCEADGYCKVADGGIATKADTGYRVMSRLDDTHVRVLLK